MARTLYDLAGADDQRRFSPYCWRIKMAFVHKELEVETVPWRFTDKDVIAFSGQGRVPVLVDGDKVVADSWAIANDLEDRYPDRKSLFGDVSAHSLTLFVANWVDRVMQPAIMQFILADIYAHLHEKDKVYFRESREKRVGTTLENFCANREERVAQFRTMVLAPVRTALGSKPFLGAIGPTYADYAVFGAFQWARATSPFKLLEPNDPLAASRERMLDLYGGLARNSLGYPV
jgi:glutathione S-transferase